MGNINGASQHDVFVTEKQRLGYVVSATVLQKSCTIRLSPMRYKDEKGEGWFPWPPEETRDGVDWPSKMTSM
jgi:hypothetical protein